MINNREYEENLNKQGIYNIVGTDEAGRGPLYGPVVVAGVMLDQDFDLDILTDSKKLSEKKRNICFDYIKKHSIYDITIINEDVIDEVNIYNASRIGMEMCVNNINKKIKVEHVLTDAMPLTIDIPHTSIIKGDLKSISISAASVLAKVTRDNLMKEAALKHPLYLFDKHKGYPTKQHIELLNKHGYIKGYRKTYGPVKEVLNGNKNN